MGRKKAQRSKFMRSLGSVKEDNDNDMVTLKLSQFSVEMIKIA